VLKVLIVEDDPVNLKVLEKIIENSEFSSISATNGLEAIQMLEQDSDIDIILLDRFMPEMDGMHVIQKVRSNPNWADIPVIFQTAADSDSEVIEGTLAGAYYYLTKPYDQAIVRSVLRAAAADVQNKRAM